jgi:hypothetical protein
MDDRRVLTLSVLVLALWASMFLDGRGSLMHAVLPDGWKPTFSPLSCPPDLPPDCIILWGP